MKYLIVGASGFVGKHLLAYVRSHGFEGLGTQSRQNHPGLLVFNLLEDRIGACVEEAFFQGGEPVCCVICSAICQIDRCKQEHAISHQVNVEQTIRLLDEMAELGAKPVFLSSDGVFEGTRGFYCEEDPPCPVNEYGRQKVEVERYLQEAAPESLTVRLSKVVGDDPGERHLLSEWYHALEEQRTIRCIEGQIFSPTFVEDVVKGIVVGCEQGLSGVYHLANPQPFARDELARQFVSALGRQAAIVCCPQREFGFLERRAEKTFLDSTKFMKATGMRFTPMPEVFRSFARHLPRAAEEVAGKRV